MVSGLAAALGIFINITYLSISLNLTFVPAGLLLKSTGVGLHPSPMCAALLLLATLGIMALSMDHRRQTLLMVAGMLGALVLLGSCTAVLGYLFGAPFLNGPSIKPMPAISAIGLMLLGAGLAAAAGPEYFPLRLVVGPSFRARMLRIFLPLILAVIFFQGLLYSLFPQAFMASLALQSALMYLLFAVITGGLISHAAQSLGYALDRAEEKTQQAEEALKMAKARYWELVDHANSIIMRMDTQGNITFMNEFGQHFFGFRANELLGCNVMETIVPVHDSYGKDLAAMIQAITETPEHYISNENENVTRDGRKVWVAWSNKAIYDGRGNVQEILCVGNDVTARKQAESNLLGAAHKWRVTFDAITDAVCLLDTDRLIRQCNHAMAEFLGKPFNKIIGQPCCELIHQAAGPMDACPYFRMMDTGQKETATMCIGDRWFNMKVDPIFNEQGELEGAVHTISDISEIKKAEQTVATSLEKMHRTMDLTVSALSHTMETRDPYTTGHQRRVTQLACAIAREMGWSDDQIDGIRVAGFLHDIGKIAVPSEILTKPGKLFDYEFNVIKVHPQTGYDILKHIEFPWPVAQAVLQHHERLNGCGYPSQLSGDEVIMEARILGVADVVEAMCSHRPYRASLGIELALAEVEKNQGIYYDPEVVRVCLNLFRDKQFKFEQ
jgi:PAS domain S-box-containing protein/putative nucleotidyltransferase with HDIG domain